MAQTEICGGNPENLSEMETQRSFWLVGATSNDPPSNAARVAWSKWRRCQTLMSIAASCAAIAGGFAADSADSADSARGFRGALLQVTPSPTSPGPSARPPRYRHRTVLAEPCGSFESCELRRPRWVSVANTPQTLLAPSPAAENHRR
jgi:hypothetical protein